MLTQNRIKFIKSLHQKKFREEHNRFIAEGHKLASELLDSRFRVECVCATAEWIEANALLLRAQTAEVIPVKPGEMERITALSGPSPVLVVVQVPVEEAVGDTGSRGLNLALDDIRDPGNMGTILRIADWFGITQVLCSPACVDLYNPKVVQATMGSIARVKTVRGELGLQLKSFTNASVPVFGAFLEGEDLYSTELSADGVIVIGSESHGVSPGLQPFISRKIFIPSFSPDNANRAESLNASVATAILCAEFRRRFVPKI